MATALCAGTIVTATASVPAAAASGSTLTILQSAAPVSLNPVAEADWNTRQSIGYIYDPLIYPGPNNTLRPGLATSWSSSHKGLVWTFNLRKGVTFQDGTPFNAQAAVFNFQLNENPQSHNYSTLAPYIKSVTAVGNYTLRIVLKNPYAEFLDNLMWTPLFVSPTAYKKEGAAGFAQHPVGTGPYEFQSYTTNSSLVLVANPHYWGGAPKIHEIKIEIVPDLQTEVVDMETHQADVMYTVPPDDVAALKAHGVVINGAQIPDNSLITFNLAKPPTNDLKVRQAIMYAIDRPAIIKTVFKGYAVPIRAGVPPTSPFYHANVAEITYSPAKAKGLLSSDGWKPGAGGIRYKDGKALSVTILSNPVDPWPEVTQIVQAELAQLGFKTTVVTQDWGTFLNTARAGGYSLAYWYYGWNSVASMDGSVFLEPGQYWNISQDEHAPYASTLLKLYNQELSETNVAQRSATLLKWQELVAKDMLVGWLWNPESISAISPKLHGYAFDNWQYLFLNRNANLSQ